MVLEIDLVLQWCLPYWLIVDGRLIPSNTPYQGHQNSLACATQPYSIAWLIRRMTVKGKSTYNNQHVCVHCNVTIASPGHPHVHVQYMYTSACQHTKKLVPRPFPELHARCIIIIHIYQYIHSPEKLNLYNIIDPEIITS